MTMSFVKSRSGLRDRGTTLSTRVVGNLNQRTRVPMISGDPCGDERSCVQLKTLYLLVSQLRWHKMCACALAFLQLQSSSKMSPLKMKNWFKRWSMMLLFGPLFMALLLVTKMFRSEHKKTSAFFIFLGYSISEIPLYSEYNCCMTELIP